MAGSTTRITGIVRKLAATTAALTTVGILASGSAAHAYDHFVVDRDAISINENNAVINASMESFHNGDKLMATLSGTANATVTGSCAKISVKFVYHDGSEDLHWRDSSPVCSTTSSALSTITSDGSKSVVRYRYQSGSLTPSGTIVFGTVHEELVGDSPDSTGSCDQLDRDSIGLSGSGTATFTGNNYYRCSTTTGRIQAQVAGTVDGYGLGLYNGGVRVTFSYTDGTTSTHSSTVNSGGTARFSVLSDSSKNVRSAATQTFSLSGQTSKTLVTFFGDIAQSKTF